MQKKYDIIKPLVKGTFKEQMQSIAEQIESLQLTYAKVFLSDAQNQQAELVASPLYALLPCDMLTIVEQPPLDGLKISVLVRIEQGCDEGFSTAKSASEKPRELFHALRLTDEEAVGHSSYEQTLMLFQRYLDIITPMGLSIETHCVRTWIYVNDIDNNYAGVVKARNEVFAEHGMTPQTHYIASTGIGGATDQQHASVAIDFLTYPQIQETDKKYLQALTHLNPTHEYGVAFERATKVCGRIFISGTASIDNHGRVLHLGDVYKQTERLQENIAALLANGDMTPQNIQYFIIYLRDVADYAITKGYMDEHFPQVPYIITSARVCRPTWLIEMECVAL